jgi:cell division protein YceG involved in septum cleavage
MSVEILLLVVLAGITLLSYMVAINSHGPTRLSISYLIATVILAGTVWVTVQYVNNDQNARNQEELKRLELEKNKAEEQVASKEQQYQTAMKQNKDRFGVAGRLNAIVTSGNALASQMMNADVRDQSLELMPLWAGPPIQGGAVKSLPLNSGKLPLPTTFFRRAPAR